LIDTAIFLEAFLVGGGGIQDQEVENTESVAEGAIEVLVQGANCLFNDARQVTPVVGVPEGI
jgi:hypothetical protein